MRLALVGAVLAAIVAIVFLGEEVPEPITRGSPAPEFRLPVLDGSRELALGDLAGSTVLVNFWATWCKPCEDEIPAMERLYRRLGSGAGDFELLAISVDEGSAEVEAFRSRYAISFPILLDPDQEVSSAYQTTGFPESFLVDAEGRVIERYIGPKEWDHPDYVARIERLVGGS